MADVTFEIKKSENWNYLLEAVLKFEDGAMPAAETFFPRQRHDVPALLQHLDENFVDLKKARDDKWAADAQSEPAPELDDVKKEKIVRCYIENLVAFRATDCEATFSLSDEMMINRQLDQSRNAITMLMTCGVKYSPEYFESQQKAQHYTVMIHNAVEDSARGRKPRQTVPLF